MEYKARRPSLTPRRSPCHNWSSPMAPLSSCTMSSSCLAGTRWGHQPCFAFCKMGSQAGGDRERDFWGGGHGGEVIYVPLKSAFVDSEAWLRSRWLPTAGLPLQGPLPTRAAQLHPVPIPVPLALAQLCGTSAVPWRCRKSPRMHKTIFFFRLTLY